MSSSGSLERELGENSQSQGEVVAETRDGSVLGASPAQAGGRPHAPKDLTGGGSGKSPRVSQPNLKRQESTEASVLQARR